MRKLVLASLLLGLPCFAEPPDLEAVARDVVREAVDGKYDAVVERFDAAMRQAVPRGLLVQVTEPMRKERGPARSVIPRLRHDRADGLVEFTVKCTWTRGTVSDFLVTVAPDGRIAGLRVRDEVSPEDEAKVDRYETKAKLRPPFHGTWTAVNAARDVKTPHFTIRGQRHAVDWIVVGANGKSYRTDGARNEDYLAYGQPALAVADGTVAVVVDGI